MVAFLKKLLGDSNNQSIKSIQSLVDKINSFEPELDKLSLVHLKQKTTQFQDLLSSGTPIDELLPEAFAVVREASKRTLGQRHYDVQLIGGVILHQGKIAEMKTGEGKTLVSTLPIYLNALEGKGVHAVTVNDYLARRDSTWMGPIYHCLGLSVGCLQNDSAYQYMPKTDGLKENEGSDNMFPIARNKAYELDVLYGTNNEFGFDYLRDNMVIDDKLAVQKELNYAIVDEVDNILIDEARTPLIISGPADEPVQLYQTLAKLVARLTDDDYLIDDTTRSISLTQSGISKIEKWINVDNMYDPENYHIVHYVENALTAHVLRRKDRDYVVRDGLIVIVDEFTGRMQKGRRWADGLHQAVEAKEGLKVQRESTTYATITLQNYFRMYNKLAGMTGTAATESEEFYKIYGLDVITIPTNKPMVRDDKPDLIFKTEQSKWDSVVEDIKDRHRDGQPVLVGTTSIENSEKLSLLLNKKGLSHNILNAKHHEREAQIIAQAGKYKAITVATNMAGRGTDIVLGGSPLSDVDGEREWQQSHDLVVSLGGLYVIGTEHHESRRIDNQLRGRSGRQGDPGQSRFYASLEDELISRFGGERIKNVMGWVGMDETTPIENRVVTKSLQGAQVKVEGHHFDIRKHLLEYDNVLNNQRQVIYKERKTALKGTELRNNILAMVIKEVQDTLSAHIDYRSRDEKVPDLLLDDINAIFPIPQDLKSKINMSDMNSKEFEQTLIGHVTEYYVTKEEHLGYDHMRTLEKLVLLKAIDTHWLRHLTTMDSLRQGIGLQAYGQRDPLIAYKTEGASMFKGLLDRIRYDVARTIFQASLSSNNSPPSRSSRGQASQLQSGSQPQNTLKKPANKIGRNEHCPCGSGKKYKRCHGSDR